MRLFSLFLLLPLAGCAGYAADYARPRASLISTQLTRYGFNAEQAQCLTGRLSGLSVWQVRQLADVAAAGTRQDGRALSPPDFVAVSSRVTDARVAPAVVAAAGQCNLTASAGGIAALAPAEAPAEPAAAAPGAAPITVVAAGAPTATSTAWVNLGSAASGQAIAVEGSTIRQLGSARQAWFRLTNPGQAATSAVSYLLRIDCTGRTINPMGFRQYGTGGTVAAERDYGEGGEGALPVEAGTVMEIAFLALCT